MFAIAGSSTQYDAGHLYTADSVSTSHIDTLEFGSETVRTTAIGNSILPRTSACGFNSTEIGYVAGGIIPGNGSVADISAIRFGDLSRYTSAATLASDQYGGNGLSARYKGYVAGGDPAIQSILSFVFGTEATATLSVTLSATTTRSLPSFGDLSKGYVATLGFMNVDKFTYATETLANDIYGETYFGDFGGSSRAGSNSLVAGYMCGSANTDRATIHKILFSTDATSLLAATLSVARGADDGTVDNQNNGYICGGFAIAGPTYYTTIDKLAFATETVSTPSATLSAAGTQLGLQGCMP